MNITKELVKEYFMDYLEDNKGKSDLYCFQYLLNYNGKSLHVYDVQVEHLGNISRYVSRCKYVYGNFNIHIEYDEYNRWFAKRRDKLINNILK